MTEEKIKPFSNGAEYRLWLDKNCDSCKKNVLRVGDEYYSRCDIEEALAFGAGTDGLISQELYSRMGDPMEFECPEWEKE